MQASMYVFLWLVLVVVGCVVYKFTVYRVPGDSVAEPEPSFFGWSRRLRLLFFC